MKKIILAMLAFYVSVGMAQQEDLKFYVECQGGSDCVKFESGSEEERDALWQATPAMSLSEDNVKSASLEKSVNSQESLNVEMSDKVSERFRELTRDNVGKRLAVVVNNKVIVSPRVVGEINSKTFSITLDSEVHGQFFDQLPWLSGKMVEQDKMTDQQWKVLKLITYVVLSVLVLGLALFYAFFKKPS